MDMERRGPAGAERAAEERDTFARVWERVAPEGGAESPIEVVPAEEYLPPLLPLPARQGASGGEEAGRLLQALIRGELEAARQYRAMAAGAVERRRRTLSLLASEEREHARRLSAAYLLLSGARYWPEVRRPARPAPAHLGALRAQFQAERTVEARYRRAAEEAEEPLLQELFLELAEEEAGHSRLLRRLLEREVAGAAR